jgi:hypothetical protein
MSLTPEQRINRNLYMQEYQKRPEVKLRHKEQQKKYMENPETKSANVEYHREYYQRPAVKLHLKGYQKEYRTRPEVKARGINRVCLFQLFLHHEQLKYDPERLTTEFMANLIGCTCKRVKGSG